MGIEIVRNEADIRLSLTCDNFDCIQDIICSPDAILLVPPAGSTPDHFAACSPLCAERVRFFEEAGESWQTVPLAPVMAQMIADGLWLPPMVDRESYLQVIRSGVAGIPTTRVESDSLPAVLN